MVESGLDALSLIATQGLPIVQTPDATSRPYIRTNVTHVRNVAINSIEVITSGYIRSETV
jgi:hypothetical protein